MLRKRQPRERSKAYLAALHCLPCVVCGSRQFVEAAHIRLRSAKWDEITGVRTGAGGAEKPSDRWCLPLCVEHHRTGPQAEHVIGTEAFWALHKLDPHAIADALHSAFPNYQAMAAVMLQVQLGQIGRASCQMPET